MCAEVIWPGVPKLLPMTESIIYSEPMLLCLGLPVWFINAIINIVANMALNMALPVFLVSLEQDHCEMQHFKNAKLSQV